ncbi:mannan endo-1,4-beta-mannosidase F [Aspergillus udagawae]|nr:mannan endo-1,4-beta-mannosidase F [Aspergillus udagawae]
MRSLSSVAILSAIGAASAQAGPWGQCGGLSYSGPTTCESGWGCVYLNDWYSQCQPGATSRAASTTLTAVPTKDHSSTVTPTSSTSTPPTNPTGSSSFAKTDGLKFNIDGETKYFAGTNSYWLPFLTKNDDVDSVFDHLRQSGLKILRIWGFNDVNSVPSSGTVYFQLHDKATGTSTINTGADGLQRLDYVVSAAEKYGIKLIIPFVNNWNDYGGMNAYVNAYGGTKEGWYTNEKIQSVYRTYIKAVVSRYRDSPAIFAWELGNEPRCQNCNTDVIYNWAAKTSAYIKSLDPNHMVTTGEEGMGLTVDSDGSYPYSSYEGNDFAKNLAIPDIDFGVYHLYVADWGISDNSWGNTWIKSHAKACEAAGKPCLFEEYGIKDNHCGDSLQWQKTSLATTGNSADLFWQYGQQLSTGASPNDHYTIYYGSDDWKCAVIDHVSQIYGTKPV